MRRRRVQPMMHSPNFGPFFSTDAGGRPNAAMQGLGQTEGVPAINISGVEDFVQTAQGMQIPTMGVFTPWGQLVPASSEFGWQVVPLSAPADTNLVAFEMGEVADLLESLGFGQPAFLALLSERPLRPQQVSRALEGTPYTRYGDGLAVYSQGDAGGMPKMLFIYWAGLRDPGDEEGGSGSLSVAAQSLDATLTFAQQVPRDSTDQRDPPTATAHDASVQQYPDVFPAKEWTGPEPPEPPPEPPPEDVEEASATNLWPPILIGLASGALGIVIGRNVGKRRRR